MITTQELRNKYIKFFEGKGHKLIPSASLIPDNDPTALFISAGMHPLVPYLLGERHPKGKNLVNYQRCFRTTDIDEVGDPWHLTFFEMLGNWSLGGYWKEDSIKYSWEFLTSKAWLGLSPSKIAVSVFAGDQDAPKDMVSFEAWKQRGVPESRIFFLPKENNWWGPIGSIGPCGPDTEIFYDTGKSWSEHSVSGCGPACLCGRWVEIWNNVFMEYEKKPDGTFVKLNQQNVDTGMGLERTTAVLNSYQSNFEVDSVKPIIERVTSVFGDALDTTKKRILTDHIRALVLLIMDGVPLHSSDERGAVARKLVRRVLEIEAKTSKHNQLSYISDSVIDTFQKVYPKLKESRDRINTALSLEEQNYFNHILSGKVMEMFDNKIKDIPNQNSSPGVPTLEEYYSKLLGDADVSDLNGYYRGTKTSRASGVSAGTVFQFKTSYGFPEELGFDLVEKKLGDVVDRGEMEAFSFYLTNKFKEKSKQAGENKFKGGLSDHSEASTKLHTATHMLQAALRAVLGEHVLQKGSNITPERLRFDFSHPDKLTPDQLQAVEEMVNSKIKEDLPVTKEVVSYEEGVGRGAIGVLDGKPGDQVSIYSIPGFSLEFCGGPHVTRTGELGKFKILKEEAVSSGVRRIKAVVE